MRLAYLYPDNLGLEQARVLQTASTIKALCQLGAEVHLVAGWFTGMEARLEALGLAGLPGLHIEKVLMWQPGPGLKVPFSSNRVYAGFALRRLRKLKEKHGSFWLMARHLKIADAAIGSGLELPLLFEVHELFHQTASEEGASPEKVKFLRGLERSVFSRAERLVAISTPLAEALDATGWGEVPALVSPSGVDLEFFRPDASIGREPDLAVYCGGLGAWKGVGLLVEAASQALSTRVVIMGGEVDDKAWLDLHSKCAEHNLGERVEMRPRAGKDQVRDLLHRASIAVWPGTAQRKIAADYTSPLKLFEYLAAGCAVIAPDVPAARAVLTHGHDCLLFRPDDPASLAGALERLVKDEELRRSLSANGLSTARRYSWQARARLLLQAMEGGAA